MSASILVVDDDKPFRDFLVEELTRERFRASAAENVERALALLASEHFDILLTDLNMPKTTGLELCRRVLERAPEMPVILLTAFGSLETALAAMRIGVFDYITKPFQIEELLERIGQATKTQRLREQMRQRGDQEPTGETRLMGESEAMQKLREAVHRLAPRDICALIHGESGSGKELVARELHDKSPRQRGPFVAVNCAALPESLVESELFGVEKGAFTDARASRPGLFVQANGGTLFLDEVGELPLSVQPKLLRALQDHVVRPVGGNREVTADVRIVAATNRDLQAAVDGGRFRADLFYRLNVVSLPVPPLRERGNDVLLLAHHFLDEARRRFDLAVTGFSSAAGKCLLDYDWPGNVRELRNCVERALALSRYEEIRVQDLAPAVRDYRREESVVEDNAVLELSEVEKRHILHVYEALGRNKTLAAKALGLDRKTLRAKLRSYGLDVRD